MLAAIVRFLIQTAEAIGLRTCIEHIARQVFIPPALEPPKLPWVGRQVPGAEAAYLAAVKELIETAFFAGVFQGFLAGFTVAILIVAWHKSGQNAPGALKHATQS